jgi:polyhydroxybutyrate depolymerase
MDGSAPAMAVRKRFAGRVPGIAGLAALLAWGAAAAMEVASSHVGHSLISRPERLFSDAAWHPPIVALVAAFAALGLVAGLAVVRSARPGRVPGLAVVGLLLFAVAARVVVDVLLPSDPGGYTVSAAAALAASGAVVAAPFAMLAVAFALRRAEPALAWAAAVAAVAMSALAPWAATWSAWAGASQPQLLALEPVEAVLALWFGLAGARLLGLPSRLSSDLPLRARIRVPSPGRWSALSIGLAMIAVVSVAAVPFARTYGPTIEAQVRGTSRVERIHADAVDRTYRVYRPSAVSASPGLVIVLHGSFGGGFQVEAMTGFDIQADRLGWIVVYPDGVADGWDAFGSGPTWGSHPGADDVVFVRALIEHFTRSDGIDPARVFITGMSRGGMMTYRLGCELADRIAAIAPVSGNMATAGGSAEVPCNPARPLSVLAIHGTADATIPIGGGQVDILFSPMADVIARWRSMDGCAGAPQSATDGAVTITTWSCADGSHVSTRIIDGGCHCWPADASAAIADFFAANPGRQGAG